MNKVIIDGNNIAYRNFYALNLKNTERYNTSVIYGMIQAVLNAHKYLSASEIIIVWDNNGSLRRKQHFKTLNLHEFTVLNESDKVSSYKEGRNQEIKETVSQLIKDVQNNIGYLGIDQYSVPDYEADDIVYNLVKTKNIKDKYYLSSSDDDWKNLLKFKNVFIAEKIQKGDFLKIVTRERFLLEFGFEPEKMFIYKTFTGDKSDRIPAVKRINKKKLIEYINKTSLEDFESDLNSRISKNKYINELFKNDEIIKILNFNKEIIKFDEISDLNSFLIKGNYNTDNIEQLKNKYELFNLLNKKSLDNYGRK